MIIDSEAKSYIQPKLEAGERLLWADKPRESQSKSGGYLYLLQTIAVISFMFVFSFFMGGFENEQIRTYGPIVFRVFAFIGLISVIWQYTQFSNDLGREFYALTNKRLLIYIAGKKPSLHEYNSENLYWLKPKIKAHRDQVLSDFGDIKIIPKQRYAMGQAATFEDLLSREFKIENIPNIHGVIKLILKTILEKDTPYE